MRSRFKMYNFNKALKNGNAKHLSFPGTTSKQLLQYLVTGDISYKSVGYFAKHFGI